MIAFGCTQARPCTHLLAAAEQGSHASTSATLFFPNSITITALGEMRNRHLLGRVLHVVLVVSLTYALLHLLYWSFSRLADDAQHANFAPHPVSDAESVDAEKPGPQKIVRFPLFWSGDSEGLN
jgi:hypothetical protein